ncbi:MAG: transposase, partial [Peptococcaceae bacterium]|nr:transposase [Peptococcaceae bacterium]
MDIEVPRDREGEFEPLVVKKHQKGVTGIEDQRGVSTRDIKSSRSNSRSDGSWTQLPGNPRRSSR